ncbi:glycoside hydrolase family 3 N-terminal domain-containing protein [uncultured Deinococcus sp.]|uniref:glycoside hydrolase family 3 N-terminal domain-containing protein n=1 Tax=uncultured Deinococcus sp. TaxID=158789 RepID=UPI00345BB9A4
MTTPPLPGALAMVDIPGPVLDPETAAHLRHYGVTAVCLFGKNVESAAQLRTLCADLRAVLGEDALIAIDHEGGAITRPTFWPYAPSAMALGAADDAALTQDVHAALARQLRSVGINWNFTPVLDVNVDASNPVISERAFGSTPALVARHGRASLAGHARAGVAACVKHFPGHGDTHLDSHYSLQRVSKTREQLDALELAPFRDLLPHTPAVMTAHIIFDAIDPELPATLSRPVLTGLLRGEWDYEGVIVTDSMGMKAIDDHYGRGEAAVLALKAGADMVMALGRREVQVETLEAVAAALDGDLDPAAVQASVERLRTLARQTPAHADLSLNPEDDAALMALGWERGLSVYRDPQPPAPGSRLLLVCERYAYRENVSERGVDADTVAHDLGTLYDVQLHAYDTADDLDWPALRRQADDEGRTLVLVTTGRHRHPALAGLTPDLHVALYNPYAALLVDAPAVITGGFRPGARAALLAWLRSPHAAGPRPVFAPG